MRGLGSGSFDPKTLAVLEAAFDETWLTLKLNGNDKVRPGSECNLKRDETFMRALSAAGFSVDDIDFVMCTHLHVDHVGWNTRLQNGRWAPTFPKARHL